MGLKVCFESVAKGKVCKPAGGVQALKSGLFKFATDLWRISVLKHYTI
jgi:hypothetical protein